MRLKPHLPARSPRKVVFRNFQSPGDILMMTAMVRDLHRSHPGRFLTDVRTPCPALWENNPYLTPLSEEQRGVKVLDVAYPLIHRSNQEPWHFLHGMIHDASEKLGVPIRPTAFRGDVHLSPDERAWMPQVEELTGERTPYWVINSGGKFDFTAKWWDPAKWQAVVDHFAGRLTFVQVGEEGHHHPRLEGVIDLRGRTDLRQLVRLVHHADGALSPVSLLMHLTAAVPHPTRSARPCVVVAGGREPSHWEAYPHHQYIHSVGSLPCCETGGCWKSRVVALGDGDSKDDPEHLCAFPILRPGHPPQPKCLDMITPDDVVRRVEMYLESECFVG